MGRALRVGRRRRPRSQAGANSSATATFDSKQINWTILGEFVLAVLVTQSEVFNRLLGTTQINLREFAWALGPPVALLVLWELGKLIARRSASTLSGPAPDHQGNLTREPAMPAEQGPRHSPRPNSPAQG